MTHSDTAGETVASLMARLGDPPDDIWLAWLHEAEQLGLTPDGPADAIWSRVLVRSDGTLALLEEGDAYEVQTLSIIAPTLDGDPRPKRPTGRSKADDATAVGSMPNRRLAIAGAVIALAGIGGVALWQSRDVTTMPTYGESSSTEESGALESDDTSIFAPHAVASFDRDADAFTTSSDGVVSANEPMIAEPSRTSSFALDSLLPASITDAVTLPNEFPASPSSLKSDSISDGGLPVEMSEAAVSEVAVSDAAVSDAVSVPGSPAGVDLMADEDAIDIQSDAVSQGTRSSETTTSFVTLPDLPRRAGESGAVALPGLVPNIDDLTLRFPDEGRFDLTSGVGDDGEPIWQIRHRSSQNAVAVLARSSSGRDQVEFRWLPIASRTADVAWLAHGRLVGAGVQVDLRPVLETDPIAMSLAQRDVKLKWDLTAPLPPRISRLRVDLELSDDLEIGWIEPIDEASPRKTRGVGVLTLADNEDVAVAFRVDIQASKTLTMRLRTGARLQSGMAWQWTDHPSVGQSQSDVTARLSLLQAQSDQIGMSVDQAKRVGSRRDALILDQRRQSVQFMIDTATSVASQLAELDRLMSEIANSVRFRIGLSVQWPDREQILLQSVEPDA